MLDKGAVSLEARHADVALGPGPVNFRPQGEDMRVTGAPGSGSPNACEGKFVPMPASEASQPGQE